MRLSPRCCRLGFNILAVATPFFYLDSLAALALAQPEGCQQQPPIRVIDLLSKRVARGDLFGAHDVCARAHYQGSWTAKA